ncbi:MAG: MltA domain-containing protein [Elusimicrobiota bacterium]
MRKTALLLLAAALPAACRTPAVRRTPPRLNAVERLAPESWPQLADDLEPATFAQAGERSIAYLRGKGDALYRLGDIRVGTQRLIDTIEELGRLLDRRLPQDEFDRRLKEDFELFRLNRSTTPHSAHYSSYYQPVLEASRVRTEEYPYPLYRKPPDMIEARLEDFSDQYKGSTLIGRVDETGRFVPYFDRRDIDIRKQLAGKNLEVAWLKNEFDRLDLHIQGSGILRYPDGGEALALFAATNARPYKSVGLTVVGAGAMTREEIKAETLRRYLAQHPEGEAWLISQNPRYTFFSVQPMTKDGEPSGSIGQPLTPGRSIAVDPEFVPLGAVAYVSLTMIQADGKGGWLGKNPARRFVHCQDTGGAIKGPGRVDLYMGHGPQAKATAHSVWDQGDMYVLLKKLPGRQR